MTPFGMTLAAHVRQGITLTIDLRRVIPLHSQWSIVVDDKMVASGVSSGATIDEVKREVEGVFQQLALVAWLERPESDDHGATS